MSVQISGLPPATPASDWVLPMENAAGDLTAKVSASDLVNSEVSQGNWLPTLLGSTANPTLTYTNQNGRYFKRGSLVTVWGRLRVASISGGSGYSLIGGLPFRSASTGVGWAPGSVSYGYGFTTAGPTMIQVRDNEFYMQPMTFQYNNFNISFTQISQWKAGSLLHFFATYEAQ